MTEPADRGPVLRRRIEADLDSLREKSQFRTLETAPGINLCSNDYLGLAYDPRLKQAVASALAESAAIGGTGSRLLSGNAPEWAALESAFAEYSGTEAALYFTSGYAANLGLLGSLLKPGDVVFSDALNHASLIDGMRISGATKVIYPHRDTEYLAHALRQHSGGTGARVIVSETVFSMEGDVAPLEDLLRLARDHGAEIVLDEAHATGTRGPRGRGIAAELGAERNVLAIVHTCGKALASAGGFVCGGKMLRNYLINHARTFIFGTAMPPYLARQIEAALGLARAADAERAHLRAISMALRKGLTAAGIPCGTSSTHIVPILLGSNEMALHMAAELQRLGFGVKAIRPPTVPAGTARIRVSLTSRILQEDIRRLIAGAEAAWQSGRRTFAGVAHV